ncbi:AAA family ATPase [Neisseria leonii]|uniref:AAA family ATPase n=1 Tax=Neisseria leonii TaxID=2995413 RepID=A0A9X4IEJ0_9NEIS|nr:AAA family ATPase [Neisseria sp. 51.81]MDD9328242.1 AAA family ATPase [Neisseria sp. 51.81]
MITRLSLTRFRQHKDLTLNFDTGITVLRGANEAGKSTVFEAATYAFFGVRACRNSDIGTWGEPENSYRVDLSFEAGGRPYELRRSPRGAEITWDGGRVTGQTEVTRFCEELLNLKPGTGQKLMFVGQNTVRGTLEETGTRSAQMIEQLAGFDQIDRWIETVQEQFPSGRTTGFQASLASVLRQIEESEQEAAALPDYAAQKEDEAARLAAEQSAAAEALRALEPEITRAEAGLAAAQQAEQAKAAVEARLTELRREEAAVRAKLDTYRAKAAETADPEAAEGRLKAMQSSHALWQDYATAADYRPPAETFPGRLTELQQALADCTRQTDGNLRRQSELSVEIRTLTDSLHNSLSCSSCGRAWDNADQLAGHNRTVSAQIDEKKALLAEVQAEEAELKATLAKLRAWHGHAVPTPKPDSLWQMSDDTWPPSFVWRGAAEPGRVTEAHLAVAEQEVRAALAAQARAEQDRQAEADCGKRLAELETQIGETTAQLPAGCTGRLSHDIRLELNDLRHRQQEMRRRESDARHAQETLDARYAPLFQQKESLTRRLNHLKQEQEALVTVIEQAEDGNRLIKLLRAVKPKIADALWKTVLDTASHYFSLMRGRSSVVSRTDNGFTVDGKDVSSLSGSTLDILGLAVRITLTKTFMPECRFILLDEPFAACDALRQSQALGFITSTGFDQILVITHEDTTEAVADRLIEL